jgi:D-alanyl-lipoteichoic acid acyltransferase DltB (MBOAT superfamily)
MLFVELRFLAFFAVVFPVFWALRGNAWRKRWLLLASYVFYASWDWRFLSLIVFSTLIDYVGALEIARAGSQARRRAWLVVSLSLNLGLLGFFKYCNIFLESAVALARSLGAEAQPERLAIVLPVGISFYTFQSMSYTIDVYRGQLAARKSLTDFALFVAFFPQLVAGPIVRARDFLYQLDRAPAFRDVAVREALLLLLLGYVKKAVLSDNLAPFVDRYFAEPAAYQAASSWLALAFYSIQIYCDFSGYSDMAIALAALLGYRLRANFDAPYLSGNVTEFWRRWHMSLSSWLRDYLYIPLGGSRGSRLFGYRNLMVTMLLGGMWHGASWNFVIWGGLHGLALVAHKLWVERTAAWGSGLLRTLLGTGATCWWILLTWAFFRSPDLATAWVVLRGFVLLESAGPQALPASGGVVVALLGLAHWGMRRLQALEAWSALSPPRFGLAYGAAWSLAFACVPNAYRPFIYFQF